MPNLGDSQHLHPQLTIHADPPSGESTRTEHDLQRHPYTNKAKDRLMPNSKIPTHTQRWATHHFGTHLPIPHPPSYIYQTIQRHFLGPGELPIIASHTNPTQMEGSSRNHPQSKKPITYRGGRGGALTSTATPTPILPILAPSLIAASLPLEHEARELCRLGPLHCPASSVAGGRTRTKRPT
jgi:hypothetical protein